MDEEKTKEKTEEETKTKTETTPTEDTRTKEGKPEFVKKAEEVAAEIKKQNEEKGKLLEREEKLQDRKEALIALGGGSPAGTKPEPPKRMTDTEYAEALERGEVNPLKEDGLI